MNLPNFIENPNPEIYKSKNYVVLDFETTGARGKGQAVYASNKIVLAVWRTADGKIKSTRGGEYDMADLVADIRSADFLVAHNAKFELQWLSRCGIPLGELLVWDTMLAEYVIGGNRWLFANLSLDLIAKRRFRQRKLQTVSKMIKRGVPVDEIPESWLLKYCEQDVFLTAKLFETQLAEITKSHPRLLPIVYTRCITTPVLADIEMQGLALDADLVRTTLQQKELEYAEVSAELQATMPGINVNSGPQLSVYLYDTLGFVEATRYDKSAKGLVPDRTEKGARRTDIDTIDKLKAKTKEQKRFKELYGKTRELHGELTKYLRKLADCCENGGAVLYASLNQTNTATHRLSSSGLDYRIQFQNIPRHLKRLFRARHAGWKTGELDGAQLEFRAAAHLGRDAVALQDIVNGQDVHAVTADVIGVSRQDAKSHTFKPLYGGRSGSPAEVRYYEFFRLKYEGITRTQNSWIDETLGRQYLETEWGLRYYFPGTTRERSGYIKNSTSICNYPVQGFATAEIIPIALVYFWYRGRAQGLKLTVVNTVHDSIVAEFPPEEEEAFYAIGKVAMMTDVYRYLKRMYGVELVVPLGCGVKIADHWGDTKDEAKFSADDGLWRPNNPLLQALD